MDETAIDYELFFDESGDFREAADAPTETETTRAGEQPNSQRKAPASQIVGLLAPKGLITVDAATDLLRTAAQDSGVHYVDHFHATERRPPEVQRMLGAVMPMLRSRNWQPVRIVNKERVDFGDKLATYTNLVAELTLRCLQQLHRATGRQVLLHLRPAGVWDEQLQRTYKPEDYFARIKEAMVRATVRSGLAAEQKRWSLSDRISFLSGEKSPQIFLCDLLSNTSYANFRRLTKPQADDLKALLGRFDFTMALRADIEQVEAYCDQGAFGMAASLLADRLCARDEQAAPASSLTALVPIVARGLASLGAPARNVQWDTLLGHIEQTIQSLRELEKGRRLCGWVRERLLDAVTKELPAESTQEVEWVRFALAMQTLIASNHLGDLQTARHSLAQLRQAQPSIVRRFERIDLFLQAQVHEAVHLTDCREFEAAIRLAEGVAKFHRDIGGLLQAAMPDSLPEDVRSDRCGQALGAAMQAAMYALHADPSMRKRAESLGDEALKQFQSIADQSRQQQYRCQLASIAGDIPSARRWLARALGIQSDDAGQLANAIANAPAHGGQAFFLLHWMRMTAIACHIAPGSDEARALYAATEDASLLELPTLRDDAKKHPAPMTQRYAGEIASLRDDWSVALQVLRRLAASCANQPEALSLLPTIALQARIAADALGAGEQKVSARALDGDGKSLVSLQDALLQLRRKVEGLPRWMSAIERWQQAAKTARAGGTLGEAWRTISGLGREFLY